VFIPPIILSTFVEVEVVAGVVADAVEEVVVFCVSLVLALLMAVIILFAFLIIIVRSSAPTYVPSVETVDGEEDGAGFEAVVGVVAEDAETGVVEEPDDGDDDDAVVVVSATPSRNPSYL
jgi:hypothetical protein